MQGIPEGAPEGRRFISSPVQQQQDAYDAQLAGG